MYRRIVVGTDGSGHATIAVDHAVALATATGASLHLVQGCGSPIVTSPIYGEAAAFNPAEIVAACQTELAPLAAELVERGLDVSVHVHATSAPSALCDVASEVDADLIVVGNRGMTGAKRLLGSVPNSVAHHAPCSVLIVATNS